MPRNRLSDGLYLIKQKCTVKGVLIDHYGILDIGNRLELSVDHNLPVVIHQTPPRIRTDWLADTGKWEFITKITDEPYAMVRIKKALENDAYDLFGNNCEHFARFVATGLRESKQLQTAVLMVGLLATTIILVISNDGA